MKRKFADLLVMNNDSLIKCSKHAMIQSIVNQSSPIKQLKSTNQSTCSSPIKQSVSQSFDQSVDKSFNQAVCQSIDHSNYSLVVDQSMHQSIDQPFNQSTSQPFNDLPASLLAYCCSYLSLNVKVVTLGRLNRRIRYESINSNACCRDDSLNFTIDSSFDKLIQQSINQSIDQSISQPVDMIDHHSLQQWLQSQLAISHLHRVRSVNASYRIKQSLKQLTPHTINQFYQSMMNLRSAVLGPTLRSLQITECDSHGTLKQGVIEWLFEQINQSMQVNQSPKCYQSITQSLKLEHLTLNISSLSPSHRDPSLPVLNPFSWHWRSLSMMTSLKTFHLIGRGCNLPCHSLIDCLPPSLTRLQVDVDSCQHGTVWDAAFQSCTFLPVLEYVDLACIDSISVMTSLATTIMSSTRAVRPIRCFVLDIDSSSNVSINRLIDCLFHVPVVLNVDVSYDVFQSVLMPIFDTGALPVVKHFCVSITHVPHTQSVDLTKFLVCLAKRKVENLSVEIMNALIDPLNEIAVGALTQMKELKSLTLRTLSFLPFDEVDLFDVAVDVNKFIPAGCWRHMNVLNVSSCLPRSNEDMSILIAALPALIKWDLTHMKSPLLTLSEIGQHCSNVARIECWKNEMSSTIPVSVDQLMNSFQRSDLPNHAFQYLRSLCISGSQVDEEAMFWLQSKFGNKLKSSATVSLHVE